MNIYDSDNQDNKADSMEQQHYYESLNWSDNLFGESIPGADGEQVADDAGTDAGDMSGSSVANEDTEAGATDTAMGEDDDEDEDEDEEA